jgi:hypothetical protein
VFPALKSVIVRHRSGIRARYLPVCLAAFIVTYVAMLGGHRAVMAEAVHYDVLVTSLSGTLVTGGYVDADNSAIAPLRVFGGESLGFGPDDPYQSDEEPGFRAPDQTFLSGTSMNPSGVYTALPGSTALTFTFQPITIGANTRNLLFWDGTGEVSFGPLTAADSLSLVRSGFGGWTRTIPGTSAGVVSGAAIDTTAANGTIHRHLTTEIASGGAGPATGFYLFALQFQMTGLAASADAYFIYGAYDVENPPELEEFEEAHEAAMLWVENNLVAVPEPSTAALAGLGAAGVLATGWRHHRRRRAAVGGDHGNSAG